MAFLEAIFSATHNLLWAQISHVFKPAIALLVETSNHSADELQDSMERHRQLMEAIRLRRPEEAEQAALRVLERTGLDLGIESIFTTPLSHFAFRVHCPPRHDVVIGPSAVPSCTDNNNLTLNR